jgi:hypothetical protein
MDIINGNNMARIDGVDARIYYKETDANNVGIFTVVKKNGVDTELQLSTE